MIYAFMFYKVSYVALFCLILVALYLKAMKMSIIENI